MINEQELREQIAKEIEAIPNNANGILSPQHIEMMKIAAAIARGQK